MFVLTKLKKSSLHEKKQEKTTIFQKSDFLNFAPQQETNLLPCNVKARSLSVAVGL